MRKHPTEQYAETLMPMTFDVLESRLLLDAADLAVTDIFRDPAQPESGQVVTLVATVVNDSNATFAQDFYADFTADGLSLTNGSGFLVERADRPLSPGETMYVTMDYVYGGSWPVIGVQIDLFDQVAEAAENNNTRTENFSIPSPDLTVESLTHAPEFMAEGDAVTFTGVIKNVADAGTVRDFTLRWYVNRGEGWEIYDSERITKDFNVGTQFVRKISFPAEFDLTQVKLSVDVGGEIDEVNEWNNDGIDLLSVAHPDLVVSDIRLRVNHPMPGQDPEIPWDGQAVTFFADIDNIASGGTRRDFNVSFIVDYGTPGEVTLDAVRIRNDMAARPSDSLVVPVRVATVSQGGWTASPGEHTITVIVDVDGEIPERHEFNNAFATVAAATAPLVTCEDARLAEPLAGYALLNIPLLLDAPSPRAIGLYYHTEDGTATAGVDYVAAEGVVRIAAGQSQGAISLKVLADGAIEGDEVFYLRVYGEDFADCPDTVLALTISDSGLRVTADSFDGVEDVPLEIPVADLLANDVLPGGTNFIVSGVGAATGGSVSLSGSVVTFIPTADFNGQAGFSYFVYDGQATAAAGSVTIGLAARNDAPVGVDDRFRTWQAASWSVNMLTANDLDVDGDWLKITDVSNAVNATVSLIDGKVQFTPEAGFVGTAGFDYTLADPSGLTSTAHVEVEVLNYLDYLAAMHEPVIVAAGGNYSFRDADGDLVKVRLSGPGEARLYFSADPKLHRLDPEVIVLAETRASSSLIVRTQAGQTTLGGLYVSDSGDGAVHRIDMPSVVLDGQGLKAGRVNLLKIAGLVGNADIQVASASHAGMKLFVSDALGDWNGEANDVSVGGRIAVARIGAAAVDAVISAETIGRVLVGGDFAASLTVTDALRSGQSLAMIKAVGGETGLGDWILAGSLDKMVVRSWTGGSLAADNLGVARIAGDMASVDILTGGMVRMIVAGEMNDSSLVVTGQADKADVLVGGWIADSEIITADGLRRLRAGGLDSTDILGGYTGVAAPQGESTLDLLDSARIATLQITGRARDASGRSVTDSRIAAGSFGKVTINRAETTGGEKMLIGAADWSGSKVRIRIAGQRRYSSLEELAALGSAESPLLEIV